MGEPVGETRARRNAWEETIHGEGRWVCGPAGALLPRKQGSHTPKEDHILGARGEFAPLAPRPPFPALSFSSLSGSVVEAGYALNTTIGDTMVVKNWPLTKYLIGTGSWQNLATPKRTV